MRLGCVAGASLLGRLWGVKRGSPRLPCVPGVSKSSSRGTVSGSNCGRRFGVDQAATRLHPEWCFQQIKLSSLYKGRLSSCPRQEFTFSPIASVVTAQLARVDQQLSQSSAVSVSVLRRFQGG
jgi:hypothetical protein